MPQNAGYMYAAYAAAGIIYGGYALSIWWRARRITRRDRPVPDAQAQQGDR